MSNPIFTEIYNLPFNSDEKTKLRIFFTDQDATKVEKVLSTITEDKEKVDYLRGYVKLR
ncbi:16711_t:CDS:1, partial [Funneliformis geosporum]